MIERIGQQLGNYRLLSLIGQGGFGEVYLGQHVYLKTQAAIKVHRMHLAQEEGEDFQHEALIIASLKHPHIVRVLDFGIDGGTPFLVMDYAQGGTLRQRHPKGSRLPLTTIVTYVKQVATALQYAHEKKLIHRDVKPENMLLDEDNEVLLSDFGIALATQSSRYQSTQEVVGTAAYMAPEQLQGKPRPSSDQYALGIVVYEWLCGERPFHGTFTELCSQHLFVPPSPLHEKVSAISSEVEQVVLTALAKVPQQRFASVKAFATALEQAYESENVSALATPDQSHELTVLPIPPTQHFWPTATVLPSNQPPQSSAMSTVHVEHEQTKRGISRRSVVIGVAGIAVAIVGGGITWLVRSEGSQKSSISLNSAVTPTSISSPTVTPTTKPIPLGTLIYTYRGHFTHVESVGWSPDGLRIASGSLDPTVHVWDATNGGHLYIYQGHSSTVWDLAWSPDGKRIASASQDGTVQVWNAVDGSSAYIYRGHSALVNKLAWSPNGERIASAAWDMTVQVWDATDGGHPYTYRGHSDRVSAVSWSPDDTRIASGSHDKTVQVWDATDGGHPYTYRGHSDTVYAVPWSPDRTRIASASRDTTVQVWDATDGGHPYTYRGHSSYLYRMGWAPEGKRIASAGADSTVQVWNAADGSDAYVYRGHNGSVGAMEWSPDGKRIASGADDMTVQIWQAS